jgi:hypothetical protein
LGSQEVHRYEEKGIAMKKCSIALACCITLAAALVYAQDVGFQPAKVVSFEKLASDAQHPEYADRYRIAFRMGNTIYLCQGSGDAATFLDWAPGKEFPAQVNEKQKQMLVNGPHGQVELHIAGKKTPK